ncbi:MAG: GEVED domain-containing protein [Candidatus Promineifilaceae bacterium]|nr:GEVED domain-containing protein [Candidatus Promineifilaceae bacterium]
MVDRRLRPTYLILAVMLSGLLMATAWAATATQVDDFQDGTTQGWQQGNPGTDSPTNVAGGGPAGADDHYLQDASDGIATGGKLVMFNQDQWTGNYTAAGIEVIALEMANQGSTNLVMRLAMDGAGGQFATGSEVNLAPGSGWQAAYFDVRASNWVASGGSSIDDTLAAASTLRLLHNPNPDWRGTNIVATIGVDNITAGPLDFGQLDQPYGLAWHTLSNQYLGSSSDADVGPDSENNDGVVRDFSTRWAPGNTVGVTVTVANGGSNVVAWLDWNGDGQFANSAPELTLNETVLAGSNYLTFTVPTSAGYDEGDPLKARFRVEDGPSANPRPVGLGRGGEVEDYAWLFVARDHFLYLPAIVR